MVDKLEGKNQAAVKEDEIEFDYGNFKDFCLASASNKNLQWDPKECKDNLRRLKRNLLSKVDMHGQVIARKVKDSRMNDKMLTADLLYGAEYST